jgi:undecaprenyl-diphosphatase
VSATGLDYRVARALDGFSAAHDGFEDALGAYVGASEALFAAIVVLIFLGLRGRWRRDGRRAAGAAVAAAGMGLLVARMLGDVVARPRPFVAHAATIHPFLGHAPDPSFPSDHATAAFAIAVAVAVRRLGWGIPLLALAVLVALGRVFLGLHYPSDVLAGALLGGAAAVALAARAPRELTDRAADVVGGALDGAARALRARLASPPR